MTTADRDADRHSHAESPELITDPIEKARREAENGLKQFDAVVALVEQAHAESRQFKLRLSTILTLHQFALEGLSSFAGNFRPASVEIGGSKHEPPARVSVPGLVEEMCDYVNDNWASASPIHLAAYVLWRLNWIHPFDDGNGRTSRAISYLVLSMKIGGRMPGVKTIPEMIADNKHPYYEALEHADAAYKAGQVDVSALEKLLEDLTAKQLLDIYEAARGSPLQ